MAIDNTQLAVELTKTVVGAGSPLSCAQMVYDKAWIHVYYGDNRVEAVADVDFTVVLAVDFNSHSLTPTVSLVNKLNALGEGNDIKVVRIPPNTNDMTETDAFVRAKLVTEFNMISMKLALMQYQLGFIPEDFATSVTEAVNAVALAEAAAAAAAVSEANAEADKTAAAASAGTASSAAGTASTAASTATTQAGIATTGAGTATTQAGIATTQAGTATTQAGTATTQAGVATAAAATATAAANAMNALGYVFSTTTTDSDPGAGTLRLNHATPASATGAFIDNSDANAVNVTALLDAADDSTNTVKAVVTIRAKADPTIFRTYNMTGSVVDGTGYRKFTLTHVAGSGTLTNAMPIWLTIDRAGDKGIDGLGAGDVVGPASATIGRVATFDNSNGKSIADGGTLLSALATTAAVASTYAPLANAALTGNPTATTQTAGNNTTRIATTAFVTAAVAAVLNGVSSAFDTLAEIATELGLKAPLASPALTGTPTIGGVPVYPNMPQNSQSGAYTLVLTDAQKHILHPSADTTARIWTIPANSSVAFPVGTTVTFINQNAGGVITIAITTDTMRLAVAGTTGSRTLATNGIATAVKLTSTEWIISGVGLT